MPRSKREEESVEFLIAGFQCHRDFRYTESLKHLDRAIELEPDWPTAHALRAVVRAVIGRTSDSEEDIATLVRLSQNTYGLENSDADLLRRACRHLGQMKNSVQAAPLLSQVLVRHPLCDACLVLRAVSYERRNQGDWLTDLSVAETSFFRPSPSGGESANRTLMEKRLAQYARPSAGLRPNSVASQEKKKQPKPPPEVPHRSIRTTMPKGKPRRGRVEQRPSHRPK